MKTKSKFLLACFVTLIVAGCVTTHSWEYRTRTTHERIGKTILDQYGRDGWELIQFQLIPVAQKNKDNTTTTNQEFEYIFKRPKK